MTHLDGLDSLLSIVQMPKGVPVATVAVDNARNAGLLAVRMLGIADEKLRIAMSEFQVELEDATLLKGRKLRADLGQ